MLHQDSSLEWYSDHDESTMRGGITLKVGIQRLDSSAAFYLGNNIYINIMNDLLKWRKYQMWLVLRGHTLGYGLG